MNFLDESSRRSRSTPAGQPYRAANRPDLWAAIQLSIRVAVIATLDEAIVTTFTAGQQMTLPIWIFSQLTRPRDRRVTNVVAFFVILITIDLVV